MAVTRAPEREDYAPAPMAGMAPPPQNRGGGLVWQASPRGRPIDATGSTDRDGPSAASAYVQVGIYRQRAEAERLRADLGNLGPVEVAPLAGADGLRYRVRIGPMAAADARATQASVAARGLPGSVIVAD
jgi:rare lipoprotein A